MTRVTRKSTFTVAVVAAALMGIVVVHSASRAEDVAPSAAPTVAGHDVEPPAPASDDAAAPTYTFGA